MQLGKDLRKLITDGSIAWKGKVDLEIFEKELKARSLSCRPR